MNPSRYDDFHGIDGLVTIAGGMVCADGVLLYSDTEWTASTLKIQRPKHWRFGLSDGSLYSAVAGAGDEHLIEFALQRLQAQLIKKNEELEARGETLTTKDVYEALQAVLNYIYTQHIYPNPQGGDVGLLMAVADAKDKHPVLFKTDGTTVLLVDSYNFVYMGYDAEFASCLTQKMFMDEMPLEVATYLACYVLLQTKRHVQTCGGESIVYALRNNGTMAYLNRGEIRDYETHFDTFDRIIQRLRLQTVNLELKDNEFDKLLDDFTRDVKLFRAARQATNVAEKKIDDERSAKPAG